MQTFEDNQIIETKKSDIETNAAYFPFVNIKKQVNMYVKIFVIINLKGFKW